MLCHESGLALGVSQVSGECVTHDLCLTMASREFCGCVVLARLSQSWRIGVHSMEL
jgi:hypothetical protein